MPGSTATAWTLDKTRTYQSQSVPVLRRAAGNGVAAWLQQLYTFCEGLKPPTAGDTDKLIVNVCFKPDDPETDSACVKAMAAIMALALSDEYYTRVMDDTLYADGDKAGTFIDLGNNMRVAKIAPDVLFKRAAQLADIAVDGVTLDDVLQEPTDYFSLTNPTYVTNSTFVDTIKDMVKWFGDYYLRLLQAGGGTVTDASRCTHMRTAIKGVCSELNVDKLIEYNKPGGKDGMVDYLLRLAKKRDAEGKRPDKSLVMPPPRQPRPHGKGRAAPRERQRNAGGRTCHQCGSEWHLIRDCDQVPKGRRQEATLLAGENRYAKSFWKGRGGKAPKKADVQLFQADGFGGYEPYSGSQ